MIPIRWPDENQLVISYLRNQLTNVTVTRTKRDMTGSQLVVATQPQQLETPISRRVAVLLEAWVIDSNGNADVAGAVSVMGDAMFALQSAPLNSQRVVRFDSPVGPSIEKDDGKTEYVEGSIVLIVSS